VNAAVRPIDDEDGKQVGRKTDAAHRLTNGEAKFDERGRGSHEEEIGRAIDGVFADVPDNAMTTRKMLGVAHDHRRVFKRRNGKIDEVKGVIESREKQQRVARRSGESFLMEVIME
jgi:hypothetical protein